MVLTAAQRRVVNVLRPFRTDYSYVAGGVALNSEWPRLSDDLDIFRDRHDQLPECVEPELQALRDVGFTVEITTEDKSMVEAILREYGFETRVQWHDEPETCVRFFPALDDDELGFRVHQADAAVNKVLCASRRRQAPRDAVDLVNIVKRYSPLGPLVWATTGKDPSLGPLRTIQNIRGIAFGYSNEEIVSVRVEDEAAMNRGELRHILGSALDQAYAYCDEIAPIDFTGCLFVDANKTPVEADAKMIADGTATAIPPKDFGVTLLTGD